MTVAVEMFTIDQTERMGLMVERLALSSNQRCGLLLVLKGEKERR